MLVLPLNRIDSNCASTQSVFLKFLGFNFCKETLIMLKKYIYLTNEKYFARQVLMNKRINRR